MTEPCCFGMKYTHNVSSKIWGSNDDCFLSLCSSFKTFYSYITGNLLKSHDFVKFEKLDKNFGDDCRAGGRCVLHQNNKKGFNHWHTASRYCQTGFILLSFLTIFYVCQAQWSNYKQTKQLALWIFAMIPHRLHCELSGSIKSIDYKMRCVQFCSTDSFVSLFLLRRKLEDSASCKVTVTDAWNMSLGEYQMYFPLPPAGGALLTFILNIMKGSNRHWLLSCCSCTLWNHKITNWHFLEILMCWAELFNLITDLVMAWTVVEAVFRSDWSKNSNIPAQNTKYR